MWLNARRWFADYLWINQEFDGVLAKSQSSWIQSRIYHQFNVDWEGNEARVLIKKNSMDIYYWDWRPWFKLGANQDGTIQLHC